MTIIEPTTCWPVDLGCVQAAWDAITDTSAKDRALALSCMTLRRLTADRVGGCPVTVRPCPQQHQGDPLRGFQFGANGAPFSPALYNGVWINCPCDSPCACSNGCELALPGVVGRVDSVQVGSTTLDLADMVLVDDHIIRWRGAGDCPFPKKQDLNAALGQPNTFAVTYLPGWPVDIVGQQVAATLALEFVKACGGDKSCQLPKNVTAVVRQGVSMTLVPGTFPNGRTGIKDVDAWVELWNPNSLKRKPSVWSPDVDNFQVEKALT